MVKTLSKEDIKLLQAKISKAFGDETRDWNEMEVEITENFETFEVEVKQMYAYVTVSFSTLTKLAEIFGTKEFDMDDYSIDGCETCDYGSEYTRRFRIAKNHARFDLS